MKKTIAGIPKVTVIILLILIILLVSGIAVFRTCGPAPSAGPSVEEAENLAEEWMRNHCPTYTFDGSSLKLVSSEKADDSVEVTFSFQSAAAGYGERSDKMVAQVISEHETVITVEENRVISAITDLRVEEGVLQP